LDVTTGVNGILDRNINNNNNNDNNVESSDEVTFMSMVEWELNKRHGRSATYTQPLITSTTTLDEEENIHSFLSEFYSYQIYDLCNDMKHILRSYHDTVAVHYGLLVPNTCSFDEFWSRYYYRCTIVQVKKDLLFQKQQQREQQMKIKIESNTTSFPVSSDIDDVVGMKNDNYFTEVPLSVVSPSTSSPTFIQQKVIINDSNNTTMTTTTNSSPTTTAISAPATNTNRIQMFYQEYDRDIIEVIPEEDENENENEDEFVPVKL
jgi:hypothetical protein